MAEIGGAVPTLETPRSGDARICRDVHTTGWT